MNQRIGVDTLDGAGEGNRVVAFSTDYFSACETNDRPQPLSPCENAVTHGLVDRLRFGGGGREEAIQRGVDFLLACGPIAGEIHPRSYANDAPVWQPLFVA